MIVTDEMLLSLADGELNELTAEKVRQAISASPQLQAEYAIYEESARLLRQSLSPGSTPQHLITAINAAHVGDINAADLGAGAVVKPFVRPANAVSKPAFWGAIAASLVLGGLIGTSTSLVGHRNTGQTVLDYATLPTGSQIQVTDDNTIRAIGSYQTDDGICRDILSETTKYVKHDLICKSDNEWYLAFSLTAPAIDGFIPASDGLTASLDSYLDAIGAGSALTAQEEQAALASR